MHGAKARVARASRIFVEGRHDAELVEKVWGDDLRIEGVVVEYLGGVDDLADHLRDFGPGPERRVGVLVDHLVAGSKESRIADEVAPLAGRRSTCWSSATRSSTSGQAVKPERLGLAAVARRPAHDRVEEGRLPHASAGRTATRPTSPGPGSTSSAG